MSELRAVVCPTDGDVIADRVGPHSVRCPNCRALICTCAGCGAMTLAARGILMQCGPCGFERQALPVDLDAPAAPVRMAPAVATARRHQEADPFLSMPMPRQRGAR